MLSLPEVLDCKLNCCKSVADGFDLCLATVVVPQVNDIYF
jgi:hypothetical protein